jgi:DNA-binding NtrC family response regulator
LNVPKLNDRLEDIPVLANYFIEQICGEYGIQPKKISDDAIAELKKINWTGNIREFRNVIERLIILGDDEISAEDVVNFVQPV